MIATDELLKLKQRMLIGADAAYQIASTSDQFVMHDHEQFELVIGSMIALKSDVRRLLAEHDILRGMFAEKLGAFFMEGIGDGRTGSAAVVRVVPGGEGVGGGAETRDVSAGTDGPVLPSGPARKRAKRSATRRNRQGDGEVQSGVGRGDREVEVDGSKDA